MKLLFTTDDNISSKLIRLIDGGPYSHVSIIEPDGITVVEACYQSGVRRRRLGSLMEDRPNHKLVTTSLPYHPEAYSWLSAQVGKSYDWGAMLFEPFRLGIDDESKWYCSELGMAMAIRLGALRQEDTIGVRLFQERMESLMI